MTNTLLHETKIHGTANFPYIVYHGKIPDFIHSYPLHWHDEAEIIYVTRGSVKITVWSNTYHVKEGDIVILLPHVIHSIEQFKSNAAEYFNIVFHFSLFENSEENICFDKYLKPFITHEKSVNCYEQKGSHLNTCLTPLLLSLIENRRESYTTCEYLVKSNLFLIMHYLNQNCIHADKNEILLQTNYHKIKTALYHVQNSYAKNITVKEAAKLCGFSASHFMKLFKELTGMSFTAYLVNYRLELSAKQLIKTDQKIIDIATNCGFNNHSYFSRTFQKKYGLTPAKYRDYANVKPYACR